MGVVLAELMVMLDKKHPEPTNPFCKPNVDGLGNAVSYDAGTVSATSVYVWLFQAYSFFNEKLFDDKLPTCLITLQRARGARGFFHAERFTCTSDDRVVLDELALNPAHIEKDPVEALGTLVHEMVHCWQAAFGKGSRGRYHNKQWAARMRSVGLVPSSTGQPGGKDTGDRVSHYVRAGGPFEVACQEFLALKPATLFCDRKVAKAEDDKKKQRRRKQTASKTKFSCPVCRANAWGNPKLDLTCTPCGERMEPEEENPFDDEGEEAG